MIPYHAKQQEAIRPSRIQRVKDHPFWENCRFAGIGHDHGSQQFFDSSPDPRDGDAVGAPTWVPTFDNSFGVNFDGISDYVTVTNIQGYLNGFTTAFSTSFWAYARDRTSRQHFVGSFQNDAQMAWCFEINSGAELRFYTSTGATFPSTRYANNLSTNTWYHFATIWQPSQDVRLWINGVEQTITTSGSEASIGSVPIPFTYGNRLGSSDYSFDGIMRDVIVWGERVITEDEINRFSDLENIMFDGAIERYPRPIYSFPLAAPPPEGLVADIFESAIIGA